MSDLYARVAESVQSVLGPEDKESGCGCRPTFEDDSLLVDASECASDGRLAASEACRKTVVDALVDRDVERVKTESAGIERSYEDEKAALLVAAGRFVERCRFHDERLAARTTRDPLGACHEATGRADAVADIAAECGLAALAERADGYETALSPYVGPTVSRWRVEPTPPSDARLVATRELPTGGTVRRYDCEPVPQYHLNPPERALTGESMAVLNEAYERLARGRIDGGDRAPARAVHRTLADRQESDVPVEQVAAILEKHARGFGLLEDLFADPLLSDAFVTAPGASNCLRVTVDGETLVTNVRLSEAGIDALASRFRRESGRAFSRADPTMDATAEIASRRIRIAGVTKPTSDGTAFAFRAHDRESWTLPDLVRNGTLSPRAAAVLSVAIERGSAVLLAGPRGAGKTTMLGALLWELPPAVRTVVIEDTPELPVEPLQNSGRDVQALRASEAAEEPSAAEALRTALRLGDGALVVGEVRGEEASVLYEAMRVGANSEAVLGTIHGDGGESVYERVVTDLGIAASAFGVTDLVVTLEITGEGIRRVKSIEEVEPTPGESPTFTRLFERSSDSGEMSGGGRTDGTLVGTGHIDRGNSHLVETLSTPAESYADVREQLASRESLLAELARRTDDRTRTKPTGERGKAPR